MQLEVKNNVFWIVPGPTFYQKVSLQAKAF